MVPANGQEGKSELLSCLILVAPSGMTEEDRANWLTAARMTLTGIPGDLLARGCKKARETCQFASQIVPAIMTEVKDSWGYRKSALANEQAAHANRYAPRLERHAPDYIKPDEAQALIAQTIAGLRGTN